MVLIARLFVSISTGYYLAPCAAASGRINNRQLKRKALPALGIAPWPRSASTMMPGPVHSMRTPAATQNQHVAYANGPGTAGRAPCATQAGSSLNGWGGRSHARMRTHSHGRALARSLLPTLTHHNKQPRAEASAMYAMNMLTLR